MFGWLPWVDGEEELSPEQQFINHYKKTGTLLVFANFTISCNPTDFVNPTTL